MAFLPSLIRRAYHSQSWVLPAMAYVAQHDVIAAVAIASNFAATQQLGQCHLTPYGMSLRCHYHVTTWHNDLIAGMGHAQTLHTSVSTLSCAAVSLKPSTSLPASIMPSWVTRVPSRSASLRGVLSISLRSSSFSWSSSSSSKARRRFAASTSAQSLG